VPTTLTSHCDCFIDNIIQVFLDSPDNRHHQLAIVPLAVFATMRPHAGDAEPVLRRPLLSPSKVAAEGALAELQIVLGWELHTRRLTISLPLDKFLAWTLDLDTTILARSVIFAKLESIVGRLNHASFVIPLSRHFVYRLHRRLTGRRAPKQRISLTTAETDDLSLWKVFLVAARDRISMNRVVTRRPTRVSLSDSCPFRLGGFLLARRLRIPTASPLQGDSRMNNILKFLAMAISIWLQVLDTPDDQDCILALADSTSAIGWLYRCGHLPRDLIYFESANYIARTIALIVTNSSCCLASQHLKGGFNVVADLLSFTTETRGAKRHPIAADDPPYDILTLRFHQSFPQLVPLTFAISPLPSEVLSFATRALQISESSLIHDKSPHTRSETGPGNDGDTSANGPDWSITPSSIAFPATSKNFCSEPFSPPTELETGANPDDFLGSVESLWLRTLSEKPQVTWLRRFGTISNRAPFTSRTATSSFRPSGPC
jgi:hypothetical protein